MTVLITGANRGIGLALATHYAAKGQSVIGTFRKEVPKPIAGVAWEQLDVTNADSQQKLAARLKDRAIDLLVCNAGVYLEKNQSNTDPKIWADTFATNVTGVFLTINNLLPNIRAARGKIAIISSAMGSDARAPGGSYIYRASKAAVLNLGRNLASDLKNDGIAVGIYHPGWVVTDMGGPSAHINVDQSAEGLLKQFARLNMENTGCFESYDGSRLDF